MTDLKSKIKMSLSAMILPYYYERNCLNLYLVSLAVFHNFLFCSPHIFLENYSNVIFYLINSAFLLI